MTRRTADAAPTSAADGGSGPLPGPALLVVCTGNVCRSPAAEALIRVAVGSGSGLTVSSAGTRALVGRPVEPPMARLLVERGARPGRAVARQLVAGDVAAADLVLTAEPAHRSAVVTLQPRAVRRTFTLLEFVDLAEHALDAATAEPPRGPTARLAWMLTRVPQIRPLRTAAASAAITDPFGQDDACYREVVGVVADAVHRLVAVLDAGSAPIG